MEKVERMGPSARHSFLEQVENLAKEVCQREGCILYDLEFSGGSKGRGRMLRVYIEKDQGDTVGVDDCANVSRGLSFYLDSDESLIPGESYTLEVSSPGLERPLRQKWHFEKSVGSKAFFVITQPLGDFGGAVANQKKFEATILALTETGLKLEVGEQELEIPFSVVTKANLIFEMTKGEKK
ncbi:MAG: ribosome maturation factor RimP [Bdellovibrionales bacterium]|nr:ribosome maturation factor RimP [Bdellovibrionales bacterium]